MRMKKIICDDAIKYLDSVISLQSVITSLPDKEELNMGLKEWKTWFMKVVGLIFEKLSNESYVIFYQTDRKYKGVTIDKSFLVNLVAFDKRIDLIFHKIVLRQKPGNINLYRPMFSHLLCYSKKGKIGKAIPDVIYGGKMIYKNAMGLEASKFACEFVSRIDNVVCDPFCGSGSILKIASDMGLDIIGIDISLEQCEKTKKLLEMPKIRL